MEKVRIPLEEGKSVYFASDMHLGAGGYLNTRDRECLLVNWLRDIRPSCGALILCGDVFDFWYEWKNVVPKGYVRIMGEIASFADAGIPVYFFTGNHDMWAKSYFPEELGVVQYYEPVEMDISGKRFFVGHGDGLGPGDHKFKAMKSLFKNRVARWMFSHLLHPDFALDIAGYFSRRSRAATGTGDKTYLGDESEWLHLFCMEKLGKGEYYDYFIFGHRHLALDKQLPGGARYINLGDWLTYFTYGQWDGSEFHLKEYLHGEK